MRPSHILPLLLNPLLAFAIPHNHDHAAIVSATLLFYRALDLKNETLLRSITAPHLVFDGALFASIGVGAPEPLVGQDIIAPGLIAALDMTTMHNVGNFVVNVDGDGGDGGVEHANVSAYVLAYHYRRVEEPAENPRNRYLMGNEFRGGLVRSGNGTGDGKGREWMFEWVKLFPFFQDGNKEVMGLGAREEVMR
jgi:hypothetical protein